jgi:hypothetical protein
MTKKIHKLSRRRFVAAAAAGTAVATGALGP